MPVEVEGDPRLGSEPAHGYDGVGGGSGAAIGAAVGAASGATAQVLTRGDRIRVPAETVLTFQTDRRLRLQGYRR